MKGFSVTLPHKEAILRYLDDCDELAASIGAVNTVSVRAEESSTATTPITWVCCERSNAACLYEAAAC